MFLNVFNFKKYKSSNMNLVYIKTVDTDKIKLIMSTNNFIIWKVKLIVS